MFQNTGRALRRLSLTAIAACAMSAMAPGTALADWLRAESKRFVVYSSGSERELREMVTELEHFDFVLRFFTGADQNAETFRKLPVYMTNNAGLRTVSPGISERIAGFYTGSSEDIFAVATREDNFHVLKHEYAHHFMKQEFNFPYPGWYVEGFAEYYAPTEFTRRMIMVGRPNTDRSSALSYVSWMPLNELLANRPLSRSRHADSYYPLAWLLTHWFNGDPARRIQLNTYLQDVGRGGDPVEAMERTTGLSANDLRKALRSYANGRIPYVGVRTELPVVEMTITPLPRSANDLLLLNQQLKMGATEEVRAATLATIRQRAASHPNDTFALLVLAHAELHNAQDTHTAEAVLKRLLEIDPNHVEGLQYMARAFMERADDAEDYDTEVALRRQAQTYLGRAFEQDDANYITFMLLSRNRSGTPGFPNENDLETMALAYELAPQLSEASLNYAQALIIHNRQAQAIPIIEIVANNPHGTSDSVRALLSLARGITEEQLVAEEEAILQKGKEEETTGSDGGA